MHAVVIIFTLLFMTYEIHKLMFTSRQMLIAGDLGHFSEVDNVDKEIALKELFSSPGHLWTFVIEIIYVLFCIVLLFTEFWLVGLCIFALVFLKEMSKKVNISKKVVWISDSFLTIFFLGSILFSL